MYSGAHMTTTLVLAARETATERLVRLVDTWRAERGLTHRQLAALLGRAESEWSHYRHHRRPPSDEFVRAVLARTGEPWSTALEGAYAAHKLAGVKSAAPAAGVPLSPSGSGV